MFRFFEKLLHPYPPAEPTLPPRGFFAFLWACTDGLRGKIGLMAALPAVMAAFEARLFAMLVAGSTGSAICSLRNCGKSAAPRSHGWPRRWPPASSWSRCRPSSSTRRWR